MNKILQRRRQLLANQKVDWKQRYVTDGLLMWLDGEHTGLNGEHQIELTTWYDQSGHGFNWVNNNATPGLKSITFDNASQTQYFSASALPTGVKYMEIVFSPSTLPNYGALLMGFGSANGNIFTQNANIAFRLDGSNITMPIEKDKIYSASSAGWLNGEQVTTGSNSTNWTAKYYRIGSYNSSSTYRYSGKIYSIRLYNRVLTNEEIQQNYAVDYLRFMAPTPDNTIPSYYLGGKPSYLKSKTLQIPEGNSLFFITDTHWTGNQKHSTDLINYIKIRRNIGPVLFGGDAFGNATTKEGALNIYGNYVNGSLEKFSSDFIPCVGDHDNNTVNVSDIATAFIPYQDQAALLTPELQGIYVPYEPTEQVAALATGETYNEIMAFFKTVYYVDYPSLNLRIISLSCGNGGNYGAMKDVFGSAGVELIRLQIPFLVSSLMSTPTGYNICVLSHKLSFGSAAPNAACSIISAFKAKKTVRPYPASSGNANIEAWWPNNTRYNFSNAPDVGFVFCLSGHTHTDSIKWRGYNQDGTGTGWQSYDGETNLDQSLGQVPHITTATDAAANTEPTGPTMTVGTVTEQCFDVITIVPDGLVLTRVGAGENRRIYMTN